MDNKEYDQLNQTEVSEESTRTQSSLQESASTTGALDSVIELKFKMLTGEQRSYAVKERDLSTIKIQDLKQKVFDKEIKEQRTVKFVY